MNINALIFALLLSAAPVVAHAHGPEGNQALGPHGGEVVEVNGHHVEFSVKDGQITLAFSGATGEPDATKGAEAKAMIQTGGKLVMLDLKPQEPNLLRGKVDTLLRAGDKLVISAKLSDGHSIQARFVMK